MTICYFGDYDPAYNRTKVMLAACKEAGIAVIHCNSHAKGWRLYRDLMRMHRDSRGKYDVLMVGYGNARLLPLLARAVSDKPVLWDALYSLYDNWVFDRKLARPQSVKAYWYWIVDWLGCKAVDRIILDTETNAGYFQRTFGVPARKLARVIVGADIGMFYPRERVAHRETFEIEFHGKYIPVQGTDTVVRAAKLLEHDGVHITMIGGGQDYQKTFELAQSLQVANVTFLPFLPQVQVVEYIRNADACVGIVGDVPRVVRAIPNKLYEAAAMGKVSINADTAALREVFTPHVDCIGISPGDPESFARAVRELKSARNASSLGAAAYETFKSRCSYAAIGGQIAAIIGSVSGREAPSIS